MVTEREREDAKRTIDGWARDKEAWLRRQSPPKTKGRKPRQSPPDLDSLMPKGPILWLLIVVATILAIGVISILVVPYL